MVARRCAYQYPRRLLLDLEEFDFRYNTRAKLGISDGERARIAEVTGSSQDLCALANAPRQS